MSIIAAKVFLFGPIMLRERYAGDTHSAPMHDYSQNGMLARVEGEHLIRTALGGGSSRAIHHDRDSAERFVGYLGFHYLFLRLPKKTLSSNYRCLLVLPPFSNINQGDPSTGDRRHQTPQRDPVNPVGPVQAVGSAGEFPSERHPRDHGKAVLTIQEGLEPAGDPDGTSAGALSPPSHSLSMRREPILDLGGPTAGRESTLESQQAPGVAASVDAGEWGEGHTGALGDMDMGRDSSQEQHQGGHSPFDGVPDTEQRGMRRETALDGSERSLEQTALWVSVTDLSTSLSPLPSISPEPSVGPEPLEATLFTRAAVSRPAPDGTRTGDPASRHTPGTATRRDDVLVRPAPPNQGFQDTEAHTGGVAEDDLPEEKLSERGDRNDGRDGAQVSRKDALTSDAWADTGGYASTEERSVGPGEREDARPDGGGAIAGAQGVEAGDLESEDDGLYCLSHGEALDDQTIASIQSEEARHLGQVKGRRADNAMTADNSVSARPASVRSIPATVWTPDVELPLGQPLTAPTRDLPARQFFVVGKDEGSSHDASPEEGHAPISNEVGPRGQREGKPVSAQEVRVRRMRSRFLAMKDLLAHDVADPITSPERSVATSPSHLQEELDDPTQSGASGMPCQSSPAWHLHVGLAALAPRLCV